MNEVAPGIFAYNPIDPVVVIVITVVGIAAIVILLWMRERHK